MADYGILSELCKTISLDDGIKNCGLESKVYSVPPKNNVLPIVLLEIEEIWTSLVLSKNSALAKLKFKASSISQNVNGKNSLDIAEAVRKAVDGKTIRLSDGKKATIKLENSVIDLPSNNVNRLRSVQQFYEAVIRG